MPLPEQAPGREPDLREHRDVVALVGLARLLTFPRLRRLCRARRCAPVAGSEKMRGRLTIFASCGAASGTWITSMLKKAVLDPLRLAGGASGELLAGTQRTGAGPVDVNVGLVVGIDDQRVGVRPAAGLH